MSQNECTYEQHQKLWDLGLRTHAVGNPLLNASYLLSKLPDAIERNNEKHFFNINRSGNEWSIYYHPIRLGSISDYCGYPDDLDEERVSLAELAADRLIMLIEDGHVDPKNLR